MKIESAKFHLAIDQHGHPEVFVMRGGNIHLEDIAFDELFHAKNLLENGQNIHTIEPPKADTIEHRNYKSIVV